MFSTRFFFIGRTPFCLAVIWILLNNIGDAIDIAWIRALFVDFNKTFLCKEEHLCDSLKLSDCFSIRLVMLTPSLLSYEWVLIYRKLCIYIFSKLGCRHLEGDLPHWKFCHKSDIYHMPLVSCRAIDKILLVWLCLIMAIIKIYIFTAWTVLLNL